MPTNGLLDIHPEETEDSAFLVDALEGRTQEDVAQEFSNLNGTGRRMGVETAANVKITLNLGTETSTETTTVILNAIAEAYNAYGNVHPDLVVGGLFSRRQKYLAATKGEPAVA